MGWKLALNIYYMPPLTSMLNSAFQTAFLTAVYILPHATSDLNIYYMPPLTSMLNSAFQTAFLTAVYILPHATSDLNAQQWTTASFLTAVYILLASLIAIVNQ